MVDDTEKQLKWFELLKTNPKEAVNKLIRNEINADPMDSKDDPAFNLRYLVHKAETNNHGKILPLVDAGLSLWFKGVSDSPEPLRPGPEFSYIVRIQRALHLVDRFDLPQTAQLLTGTGWEAWFDTLRNDTDLKHPKQTYQKIILSKGNYHDKNIR